MYKHVALFAYLSLHVRTQVWDPRAGVCIGSAAPVRRLRVLGMDGDVRRHVLMVRMLLAIGGGLRPFKPQLLKRADCSKTIYSAITESRYCVDIQGLHHLLGATNSIYL